MLNVLMALPGVLLFAAGCVLMWAIHPALLLSVLALALAGGIFSAARVLSSLPKR